MSTDGMFQILFKQLCDEIRLNSNLNDAFSKEFELLDNNLERVDFLIKHEQLCKILSVKPSKTYKDYNNASSLKDEGNKHFRKKNHAMALSKYNKALILSPVSSDDNLLALCYANRSAVLFYMEHYEECLQDIDRAIKHGYTRDTLYKLLVRRAKCYQHVEHSKRDQSIEEAMNALSVSSLNDEGKKIWQKELANLKFYNKASSVPVSPSLCEVNELYPALNKAVGVAENNEFGRYVQAQADLSTGDVLLLEKPYCSVTLSDYYLSHCCHCQKRVGIAPIPCEQCADVVYCSEACQTASWKLYHKFECDNILNLRNVNVNMGHLAFRTACQAGISKLNQIINKDITPNPELYDNRDYIRVFGLEGHEDTRTPKDVFWRSCAAVLMASMCDLSKWADGNPGALPVLASFILHHMMTFPCNAHEIFEMAYDAKVPYQSELLEVGAGIYCTLSLFNHSCDPSVVRTFCEGNTCALKALAPISKYEQVFDNYGCLYAVHTLQERWAKLKEQYYFECCCYACMQDWPLYQDISYNAEPMYKCQACATLVVSERCDRCALKFDKQSTDKILAQARDAFSKELAALFSKDLEGEKLADMLKKLISYSNLVNRMVFRPYKSLNDCQEALKHVYNMYGNRSLKTIV